MLVAFTAVLALLGAVPPLACVQRTAAGWPRLCATEPEPSLMDSMLSKVAPAVTVEIQRAGSEALMRFSLSAAATGAALAEVGDSEQSAAAALSLLLEREVPSALLEELQRDGAIRLLGQAQLAGETPVELLARFEPGEPLALSMVADVWPEVPRLKRDDYFGLTLVLPKQVRI